MISVHQLFPCYGERQTSGGGNREGGGQSPALQQKREGTPCQMHRGHARRNTDDSQRSERFQVESKGEYLKYPIFHHLLYMTVIFKLELLVCDAA